MTPAGGAPLTQYFVAASLDGFIATEDDNLDWLISLDSGADGGDTQNPYSAFMKDVGAVAMGAATYEWVLEHDPGPWGFSQPTWVFTHRDLPLAEGGGEVKLTDAPVTEVHAEMVAAAGGRNVWLVGGGELVGQFLDEDLLDEIWLSVTPVVLGAGKPLLPRRRTTPMRLLSVTGSSNGTFAHLRLSLR
jgi:dihydrofolate reductase